GFVRDWMLAAPFDSTGGIGYTRSYEPEMKVDLAAVYKGKQDAEARWQLHRSDEPYGVINLNKTLANPKAAAAYPFVALESPTEQPVDIRLGTPNAIRVFLNGEQVFAFEEYHHGARVDQYLAHGKLKKGRNELLVKVCQNEQTEEWAQEWQFQLRIC